MANLHTTNAEVLNITDTASLEMEIAKVKLRVKISETALQARFSQLPKESMKSAATAIVPTFLTTKIVGSFASIAWNIVKITAGNKKAILPLLGSAAKAGIFSLLKKKVPVLNKHTTH